MTDLPREDSGLGTVLPSVTEREGKKPVPAPLFCEGEEIKQGERAEKRFLFEPWEG